MKAKKGFVPCHHCSKWSEPSQMITSMRETHEFFNPKHIDGRVSNGKLCVECTHMYEIDETRLERSRDQSRPSANKSPTP